MYCSFRGKDNARGQMYEFIFRQKKTVVYIRTSYVSWGNTMIFLIIAVENDVDKTRSEMTTGKKN